MVHVADLNSSPLSFDLGKWTSYNLINGIGVRLSDLRLKNKIIFYILRFRRHEVTFKQADIRQTDILQHSWILQYNSCGWRDTIFLRDRSEVYNRKTATICILYTYKIRCVCVCVFVRNRLENYWTDWAEIYTQSLWWSGEGYRQLFFWICVFVSLAVRFFCP